VHSVVAAMEVAAAVAVAAVVAAVEVCKRCCAFALEM